MLVVSGVAADLDYASYFGGASAFMRFHRTTLHSLAGSALMACVFAGAFCVLDRKWPQKKLELKSANVPLRFMPALAVCAVGAAGHVLLDLASGVGVQLLWPFRAHWTAWDLATNFDPWILAFLVAGLLLPILFKLVNEEVTSGQKKRTGQGSAAFTLLLIAGYLGARAHWRTEAVDLLLSREYHGRIALSAEAFPASSAPYQWRGIVDTDDTMELVDVPLGPGDEFDSNRSATLFKPQPSPALVAGEDSAAARAFLLYAKVPFAQVRPLEAGYRVEIRDLRFAPGDYEPASIFARIDLNSRNQTMRQGFFFASNPNE